MAPRPSDIVDALRARALRARFEVVRYLPSDLAKKSEPTRDRQIELYALFAPIDSSLVEVAVLEPFHEWKFAASRTADVDPRRAAEKM
jgi:hypothetical protein